MKRYSLAIVIVCAAAVFVNAEQTLLLPKLQKTAQGAALGDGAAALAGLNAQGINPAGIASQDVEFMAQYQPLLEQSNLAMVGLAYPLKTLNTTLSAGYMDLRSGNFDKRDSLGRSDGTFSVEDRMGGVNVSVPVSLKPFFPFYWKVNPLYLGVGVKQYRFQIATRSAGTTAWDAGVRHALGKTGLTLGAAMLNIGRGVVLYKEESRLPTTLLLSAAYQAAPALTLTGSYSSISAERRSEFSAGSEIQLGKRFCLRGRYALMRSLAKTSDNTPHLTAGFGLKILKASALDYAFQSTDESSGSQGQNGLHQITFTFRFAPPTARVRRYTVDGGGRVIEVTE